MFIIDLLKFLETFSLFFSISSIEIYNNKNHVMANYCYLMDATLEIENSIMEAQAELNNISELRILISDKNITALSDFGTSSLSPLNVILGKANYSKEHYLYDSYLIYGYVGNQRTAARKAMKKSLIKIAKNISKKLPYDNRYNLHSEYTEYLDYSRTKNGVIDFTVIYFIQKIVKSLFMLKAHFLKYQLLDQHYFLIAKDSLNEIQLFINDYEMFLRMNLEDLINVREMYEESAGNTEV